MATAPRPLPRTIAELKCPNLGHDYFRNGATWMPRTGASTPALENAWWCAEFCTLAYADSAFIVAQLQATPFRDFHFHSEHSTTFFSTMTPTLGVLCFRGTAMNDLSNLLTDIKVKRVPFATAGLVHSGFLQALDKVWIDIEAELAKFGDREIWLTGHSLGAALALLTRLRWQGASSHQIHTTTFGCPRIGDEAFAKACEAAPHASAFVNEHDLVTRMPPKWLGYRDHGQAQQLMNNGKIGKLRNTKERWQDQVKRRIPSVLAQAKSLAEFKGALLEENAFSDHAPVNYALRLWNLLNARDAAPPGAG